MKPTLVVSAVLTTVLLGACAASDSRPLAKDAAAAASPAWPASTKSAEAQQHLADAEAAWDAGLIDDSYQNFKRAVAADSAFAFGYLRLAQTAYSLDEYKANLERANALKANASPAEKLMIESENRVFAGDIQGGIDSLRKAAALMPNNPRPLALIEFQQLATNQTDSSRATAARIMEIAPQWGRSHLDYSEGYSIPAPRDFAKAEEHQQAGQKLWPDKPYTYDALGDLRRAQNRLDEAAAAYGKQIELSPKDEQGYNQRGHAYTFLGKFDEARADYASSIRVAKGNGPAVEAWYRALVDAYAGQPDKSVAALEQLVEAIDGMGIPEPEGIKTGVLQDIIIIAAFNQKPDVAQRALDKIIPLNNSAAARVNTPDFKRGVDAANAVWTGFVANAKGDFTTARAKAEEYRKLREPDRNATKLFPYYNLVGHIALAQKKYDEADKALAQSNPENMEVQYARAQALDGLGKTEEAKAIYKRIAVYNFSDGNYATVRRLAVGKAK